MYFFRSYEKRYQKSTRRVCAPSRLPGDAVKFLRFDGDTGNFAVSSNARKHGFSLLLSDMGLTHAVFFGIFRFFVIMGFDYSLSFRAGVYGTKTGLFSRKIKLVIFSRLFAKLEAAHNRPKKYAEGVRTLSTPMGMGDDMYFFRLYEKSTKKVHRGLASPLDSRGRRKASAPLRSAGFTAIPEIPQYVETQENAVFLYFLMTAG